MFLLAVEANGESAEEQLSEYGRGRNSECRSKEDVERLPHFQSLTKTKSRNSTEGIPANAREGLVCSINLCWMDFLRADYS